MVAVVFSLVLQGQIEEKCLVAGNTGLALSQVKEARPYIWPCSTRRYVSSGWGLAHM